jgi:predicted esterase
MIKRKGKYALSWSAAVLAVWILGQCGCAVPQRPGKGYCARLVEPQSNTGYWLYLPEDYVQNQGRHPVGERWPLVVTFHGLRPYDDANPQIREWQAEADRYNFIVIAPQLRTCDSLYMQYPLVDPELPYVKQDERGVLAVMDEVMRRTDADPSRVLATSFSSGGYMAHYMVNRHPERFSCLAVRGSNFSEALLDPGQIPKYRNMKIGIFFGEHDFKPCRDESVAAVEWYRRHRFDVAAKKVGGLGHERKPEIAAALFAGTIGVNPKTPPDLGPLVMLDVAPTNDHRLPPRREPRLAPRTTAAPQEEPLQQSAAFSPAPTQPPSPSPVVIRNTPAPLPAPTVHPAPSANRIVPRRTETPKRPAAPNESEVGKAPRTPERTRPPLVFAKREQVAFPPVPASIRLHGDPVGRAPMWVSLSVELPANLKSGASVLWTDNGQPIPSLNSFETQTMLNEPGEHDVEAHIITADDRKAVLRQTITVLGAATQPAS